MPQQADITSAEPVHSESRNNTGPPAGRVVKDFALPLILLTAGTLLFRLTSLDLELAEKFYSNLDGWYLRNRNPWIFLYNYASAPAFLIAGGAIVLLVSGFFSNLCRRFRKISLFLLLLLALGPGLVVNVIFKDHWGRPRPHEISIFGGTEQHLPVWVKGPAARNGSFPSGHASVAFFLMAPYFFLKGRRTAWARFFLGVGLAAGTLVGLARMVQGGHFASDVLWAGGFVYLTGLLLYYLSGLHRSPWYEQRPGESPSPAGELLLGGGLLIFGLAVASYIFIDLPLANFFHDFNNMNFRRTFNLITKLGKSEWYLIPAFMLFLFYRKRNRVSSQKALYLFSVVALTGIIVDIVKIIAGRFRPKLFFHHGWYGFDFFHYKSDFLSFPSGHAATALSVAVALGISYPALRQPLLIAAFVVAASRVVLASHYLSDVLIGGFIGIAVSVQLYRKHFNRKIHGSGNPANPLNSPT